MKKRESNFEVLRIVSIGLIVAFHYIYKGGFNFAGGITGNKILFDLFYHFGELGVNCFILISGYFFDVTNFNWKKIVLIFFQVWFYLFLCRGILIVTGRESLTSWGMTSFLFPILRNYYWFVTVYIYIYILSPYIRKFVYALSRSELRNLIIVQLLIWSAYPTIILGAAGHNDTEAMPYYNRYIWLLIVYLIGAYIKLYGLNFIGNLQKALIFESATVGVLIVYILIIEMGFFPLNKTAYYFWPPNSILQVMLSIGLFVIFTHIKIEYKKWINYISSCTLGIYMLHDGDLVEFWWNSIFKNATHQNQNSLILHILIAVVVIVISGIFFETIRKVVEIPVKRILDMMKWEISFSRKIDDDSFH